MMVLILRTFAHSNVWEGNRDHCEFETGQLDGMIYEWEHEYKNFEIDDFDLALGIYTTKYFTHRTFIANNPVFQGSENEQIISLLKLEPYNNTNSIVHELDDGSIQVRYSFVRKLWDNPNKSLMFSIDDTLITEKRKELINKFGRVPKTQFIPLSFSLDEEIVNSVLSDKDIKLNK